MTSKPSSTDAGESDPEHGGLRDEIALSWRRAMLSGLRPEDSFDGRSIDDIDRRSRLLDAATPILDRMQNDLVETRYCVLLADRDARLVDLRVGQRKLEDLLADDGAVRGRLFTEENTGTNSIATVHETRRPLAVRGEEHFVEAMKKYSCYGYPITHPTTRRIEGILDVTFLTDDDSPLLRPLLTRAVEDVQRRLLESARSSETALLGAFQESVARRRDMPVVALGEDVFFANSAAQRLLDSIDQTVLRALTEGTPVDQERSKHITLNSGLAVQAKWARAASRGGVLIELSPVSAAHAQSFHRPASVARHDTTNDKIADARRHQLRTLISGEPGTGKTRTLEQLAGSTPTAWHPAVSFDEHSSPDWEMALSQSLSHHRGLVVVDDFHLLPAAVARRTCGLLAESSTWWAVSSGPLEPDQLEHRRILSQCTSQIELPPLRARADEIPSLAREMLAELGADNSVRLTPGAITVLTRHTWPGNLTDLRTAMESVLRRRSCGDVTERDLDDITLNPRPALTPLQDATRHAIEHALSRTNGSKVAVAKALGISRTTLYKRMHELGIVG